MLNENGIDAGFGDLVELLVKSHDELRGVLGTVHGRRVRVESQNDGGNCESFRRGNEFTQHQPVAAVNTVEIADRHGVGRLQTLRPGSELCCRPENLHDAPYVWDGLSVAHKKPGCFTQHTGHCQRRKAADDEPLPRRAGRTQLRKASEPFERDDDGENFGLP